jgi:hypothetical protein
MKKPCAWVVNEIRIYGAPGETRKRVLWVSDYLLPDNTHPDLDYLLNAASQDGGIDGRAKTISVKPLFDDETEALNLLVKARNLLSHPESWCAEESHAKIRRKLSEEIATYLADSKCGLLQA